MKRLMIALIHNGDRDKLNQIRKKILLLSKELSKEYEVIIKEVSHQSKVTPVSLYKGIYRDIMYWRLNRQWNKYKKVKNLFLPLDICKLLFKSLGKYFNQKKCYGWLKSCSIEMIVSKKHLLAIDNSLENNCDYLLVFEDDAVFKEDSISRFKKILKNIKNKVNDPAYLDLAGGLSIDKLQHNNLEEDRIEEGIIYLKPVTNTACSYLINKKQLEVFNYFITRNPELYNIGIDWLFNKIFIFQEKSNIKSRCMHFLPSIFEHGSMTGRFRAWERE